MAKLKTSIVLAGQRCVQAGLGRARRLIKTLGASQLPPGKARRFGNFRNMWPSHNFLFAIAFSARAQPTGAHP